MQLTSSNYLSRIISRTLPTIPSKFLYDHFKSLNTHMKKPKSTKFVCFLRNLKSPWKDYMTFYKNYGKSNLYIIVFVNSIFKVLFVKYFYRNFFIYYMIYFSIVKIFRNFRNQYLIICKYILSPIIKYAQFLKQINYYPNFLRWSKVFKSTL